MLKWKYSVKRIGENEMGMSKELYQNAKKPQGSGGKFVINRMNERHRHLAKWGFLNLEIKKGDKVLDVGCGGGANLEVILQKINNGEAIGIDYSEVSVEIAKKRNKKAVETGKCKILQGDVMQLPLHDEDFDVVTAFETVYFWPEMKGALKEIYRVLKPGGRFMICNEADGEGENDEQMKTIIEGMSIYTEQELRKMLQDAGFKNINVYRKQEKHWLSTICEK